MTKVTDLSPGTRLRAEFTGKTYRVEKVEDGKVYVTGLPPVSEKGLQRDIANGKISVLN